MQNISGINEKQGMMHHVHPHADGFATKSPLGEGAGALAVTAAESKGSDAAAVRTARARARNKQARWDLGGAMGRSLSWFVLAGQM